ncbi:Hpt domain-containing protein [Aquabacterium sp.]|uniref:Hpt domain-containing protein n=1 Tax=Aquabacterium sp. TaxID=1872578 RepID=UPI0035AE9B57
MNTRTNESNNDLSALAWVQEELRKSLDTAHKALRRYLKEAEANSGSDVDAVDPAVLRTARLHVHQGVGALELVNLSAGATLLRASEAAVQRFVAKPHKLDSAAADVIERASFALLDYITRLLAGKPVPAVALYPQYQALQTLAGAERAHPADLWPNDWRWRDWSSQAMGAPRAADAQALNEFESLLLTVMRNPGAEALRRMASLCADMAGGQAGQLATLWKLAAALFEGQAEGRITSDLHTKRAASRLLAQLRGQLAGNNDSPQRLAQDLLFFCAQARTVAGAQATPNLDAARAAYELTEEQPVDYHAANLGRFDPAWITQARKRVASAKEVWSAVAGGELLRLSSLPEQFALVGDSLVRLYPEGESLSNALQNTMARTVQTGAMPPAPLAMEVATSVLYLEASLEDGDFDHPDQAQRVKRLADRIEAVRAGAEPEPLESWMEELYRRVSDRQTMGSVVQELRNSLSEAEKQIDQFFRKPDERGPLIQVPGQLKAMRGVFSVLDLSQASQAVVRMCDDIDRLTGGQIDTQQAAAEGYFDRLASNLGALGFLIDMLSVQPQLAKSLFKFDADTGLLKSLMGRRAEAAPGSAPEPVAEPPVALTFPDAPRLIEQAQSVAEAVASDAVPLADVSHSLNLLSNESVVTEQPALAASISNAQAALEQAEQPGAGPETVHAAREQVAQAMADFVESVSEPIGLDELGAPGEPVAPAVVSAPVPTPVAPPPLAPVAAPTVVDTGLEEDDEMRGIFLEEAREVIENAREALQHLATEPSNIEQITVIRRAFHTLKGSSRMVGLNEFGEAGWACEQLYNTWLASQHPASPDLQTLTHDALDSMRVWTDEIEARSPDRGRREPICRSADALRQHGEYIPLAPVGEAPVAVPEVVEAAPIAEPVIDAPAFEAVEMAAPVEVVEVPEAVPAPEAVAFSLDLSALEGPSEAAAVPVVETLEPAQAPELTFDLSAVEPERHDDFVDTTPSRLASLDETVEPLALDLSSGAESVPEMAPVAEPEAVPTAEVIQFPTPVPEVVEPEMATEGADDSANEQVKVIGSLRISIPLFNIFLNEADELSRRLTTELAEWSMELHRSVSDAAVALAHSLAGNSATVGFQDLSHLARQLEHALMRSQALGNGTPEDAQLYSDVAEEIRRLLHQFAAGFLKAPAQTLLDRLTEQERDAAQRLEARSHAPEVSEADSALDELPLVTDEATESADAVLAFDAPPVVEPELAPDLLATFVAEEHEATAPGELGQPEFKALEPLHVATTAAQPVHTAPRGTGTEFDEDLDAVDAVDADLFPIFEEEAQELLPALASQMRDWVRRPGDPSASTACMRTLHTLKGGARLAGAMRLGELAHRLESAIEKLLARGNIQAGDVEDLQGNADALNEVFEALRNQDAQAYEQATQHVVEATPAPAAVMQPLEAPVVHVPTVAESLPPVVDAPAEGAAAESAPVAPAATPAGGAIDWSRFAMNPVAQAATVMAKTHAGIAQGAVRVRAQLLDRLVNQAGEVSISRSRLASEVTQIRGSLNDLTDNLERLRQQLRDIELQAETQMGTRMEAARAEAKDFDPLEFDRYTRFQELTRMMAESVNDVATVQRALQRTIETAEDQLATQARLTRDLQDDLLRTRMVEFEGLSDRLYRVVRLAAKETGKQVRLDIVGGSTEVDRGVLDRMTPAFEHLLRNCVSHGIESPEARQAAGKDVSGLIVVSLRQEGNEVSVEFRDDGAGLNLERIRQKGVAQGLLQSTDQPTEAELASLIFTPGFSTADTVTELAGRGIGMDVVRNEVNAMGGRIETATATGQGTSFKLVLPLTTAVTQVVMLRCGDTTVAVPTHLIEIVRRAKPAEVEQAYQSGVYTFADLTLQFFWLGSLLHISPRGTEAARTLPIVVIRSAAQRVALHVDEVLGNQEVVVKNLGPQLARLPGLAGMTLLASGAVALIYNPVALATVYGEEARAMTLAALQPAEAEAGAPLVPVAQAEAPAAPAVPLILVVDDSLTVRRVTQRLLAREGYRVTLAKDGLDALERLAEERPAVVLSDIEMPRMDGFDLVRNIRADKRLADLPVVMITSRIAQKHRDYASELGVNHYLGKPYSEEELLALIGHYTALTTAHDAAAGAAN